MPPKKDCVPTGKNVKIYGEMVKPNSMNKPKPKSIKKRPIDNSAEPPSKNSAKLIRDSNLLLQSSSSAISSKILFFQERIKAIDEIIKIEKSQAVKVKMNDLKLKLNEEIQKLIGSPNVTDEFAPIIGDEPIQQQEGLEVVPGLMDATELDEPPKGKPLIPISWKGEEVLTSDDINEVLDLVGDIFGEEMEPNEVLDLIGDIFGEPEKPKTKEPVYNPDSTDFYDKREFDKVFNAFKKYNKDEISKREYSNIVADARAASQKTEREEQEEKPPKPEKKPFSVELKDVPALTTAYKTPKPKPEPDAEKNLMDYFEAEEKIDELLKLFSEGKISLEEYKTREEGIVKKYKITSEGKLDTIKQKRPKPTLKPISKPIPTLKPKPGKEKIKPKPFNPNQFATDVEGQLDDLYKHPKLINRLEELDELPHDWIKMREKLDKLENDLIDGSIDEEQYKNEQRTVAQQHKKTIEKMYNTIIQDINIPTKTLSDDYKYPNVYKKMMAIDRLYRLKKISLERYMELEELAKDLEKNYDTKPGSSKGPTQTMVNSVLGTNKSIEAWDKQINRSLVQTNQ